MPEFDVVDLEPTDHPEPGERVPDFTRPLVNHEYWEDRSLSELVDAGDTESESGGSEPTIVVFTPMVGSFLATYVWDELAEREWDERAGRVVGITAANPYAVKRFLEENDLPFSLFADPANGVAKSYDVVHDLDGMAGITEPRLAFLALESDLSVADAWVATEWPGFPDYDDLEERFGLE
ncbi:redoxin domain-containing protein [Natrialba sp. INN-245]|uniref:redoxin domain-containing protein n=1 Tax=Natrialba sp. INN-245 TaxID=2690967 RepID=UPI0013116D7C|nr:redoxin domain-containing protein [Natrialba sp. INN-245]MWV38544.1 redoxin domain-containing protein [Natrialba sp. INN-245]